jgi:two-component system copper resistance phosphate regulon response regulator CusR
MRILIIEDEKKTAAFLREGLTEAGFIADVAEDGEEGRFRALNMDYDLIILDAMLPRLDGGSIVADVRRGGKSTPVLFLSARGEVQDRVRGLELGADDYLVKPYAFTELLARVRALLRRRAERQPEVLQIADLRLDLLARRSLQLTLQRREFGVYAVTEVIQAQQDFTRARSSYATALVRYAKAQYTLARAIGSIGGGLIARRTLCEA